MKKENKIMKGLTIMNEGTNRARRTHAAVVLTLLILLLGVSTTTRAQGHAGGGGGGTGKVSIRDFRFSTSVGVARGQLVRVRFRILDDQAQSAQPNGRLLIGSDLGVFGGHVKVFDALTGAEIKSFELRNPTAGIHTFDIGGSGDDILFGGDTTYRSRIQLRIEVKLIVCYDSTTNEFGAGFFLPTFQVVQRDSGRTAVYGGLAKVRPGTLVLANANTY